MGRRKTLKILFILASLLGLSGFYYLSTYYYWQDRGLLEIFILDVGQGDAILIRTPDNNLALIDAGPSSEVVLEKLSDITGYFQKHIDLVVATHPDADHIAGLIGVIDYYKIGDLLWSKSDKDSTIYNWLKQRIFELGVNNYVVDSASDFTLGCCVEFDVVWPSEDYNTYDGDANAASVAVVLSYGDFQMYLGGDLGVVEEERSLNNYPQPNKVDVLKVGHHGSNTSTSERFLSAIDPNLAIISAGLDNSYGHPHPEVLSRLESNSIRTVSTEESGNIKLITNGEYVWVKTTNLLEEFGFKL